VSVTVPTSDELTVAVQRIDALESTDAVPGPQGAPGPAGPMGPAGGSVPGLPTALDSYLGSDDQRLAAFLAAFDAAPSGAKPVLALAARSHVLTGQYNLRNGLQILGPGAETEFGNHCTVAVRHAAGLFIVPAGNVRDVVIQGVCFVGNGSNAFVQDSLPLGTGPQMQDVRILDCGFKSFRSIMKATHLRCTIDRTYVNGGTGTQFALAGSDNQYWPTAGSYMSSTTMPAGSFYLDFVHMSQTIVGPLYLTTETVGVRVQASYGQLRFEGTRLDGTNRPATRACQAAGLLITGGVGVTLRDVWTFNNAAGAGRGQIEITGGSGHRVLNLATAHSFGGFVASTPATKPAVYSTVPIKATEVFSDGIQGTAVVAPA